MAKKVINKNVFLCRDQNLNWGILNKNSVTFKRWDGVKDDKFLILWKFTEKLDF